MNGRRTTRYIDGGHSVNTGNSCVDQRRYHAVIILGALPSCGRLAESGKALVLKTSESARMQGFKSSTFRH